MPNTNVRPAVKRILAVQNKNHTNKNNNMANITNIAEAWVELYDDKAYGDRKLTIRYPATIEDMKDATSDDGKAGFNDKASSAKWQIPAGWQAVLFDDTNHKDSRCELIGTGGVEANPDLGSFSDKCSSIRWEQK